MFKRFWRVFLLMPLLGPNLGLTIAGVVTYAIPKKYESQAIIEITALDQETAAAQKNPLFYDIEFEKATSEVSLKRVASNLELSNKWQTNEANTLQILRKIVVPKKIQGSNLIAISVRHSCKEDSRDIAAEFTRAYRIGRRQVLGSRKCHRNDVCEPVIDEDVIIHKEPQIPQSSSSPNVTLNLLFGTSLGFLISPLLALPVIWILNLLIPIQKTPPLTQAN